MGKKFVIIGHAAHGMLVTKMLADKNLSKDEVTIITPEEAKERGLNIINQNELKGSVDELVLKLSQVEHEEVFKPKKIHPKHQRQNKYRYNK